MLESAHLLIDERQGRVTAEARGVAGVGSIGILVAAKARGDVLAVRRAFNRRFRLR